MRPILVVVVIVVAMPLPVIADCYRVAFDYINNLTSDTATNVIHILAPASDEGDVFTLIDGSVAVDMWAPCTQAIEVNQVVITKLDGTPDGVVFGQSEQTGLWPVGAGSQQFMPQVAALVKLATAATGRSGRGRVFLPWVQEGATVNGLVDDTSKDNCTAAWVQFANLLVAGDMALAVASYTNESAAQVLNLTCESRTATQRRRQHR